MRCPAALLISGLSNAEDKGGKTGLVEYNNAGRVRADGVDAEGRAVWIRRPRQPRLNRMLTSSFTGWKNYMRPLPELLGDAEAMKNFGSTMVVWDFHARKPIPDLSVPGAPLEIRWRCNPRTTTPSPPPRSLEDLAGLAEGRRTFAAEAVGDIGDPKKIPLPVDISLSLDDRTLFVDSFMDGMVRVYDVSSPKKPKLVHEQKIGAQVNMVSQSWTGEHVYFTSSLLAGWDKTGKDDEQFLKAYRWDGKKLSPLFSVDFKKEKLGRPHITRFGQDLFYKSQITTKRGGGTETRVAAAE